MQYLYGPHFGKHCHVCRFLVIQVIIICRPFSNSTYSDRYANLEWFSITNDATDQPVGGIQSDCGTFYYLGTPAEQLLKKYPVPGTIT